MFGKWVNDFLQPKGGDLTYGGSVFWENITTGGMMTGISKGGGRLKQNDECDRGGENSSSSGGVIGGGDDTDTTTLSDNGGAFIDDNNVNRGGSKDTTSLTALLLPTLPTPEQIKHQMFLASQHLNVQEWESYLRESTARSDLTGMFDWARSDLTGKFDWARSDLTGLSKWERYMRDTTTTLRHSFDRQVFFRSFLLINIPPHICHFGLHLLFPTPFSPFPFIDTCLEGSTHLILSRSGGTRVFIGCPTGA